jgi:radical SAM protein with 4Fe4S-binding SPASM domain
MEQLFRFVIKKLFAQDRYVFLDLFSDFKAVMDSAGVRLVNQVFNKQGRDLSDAEAKVADALITHHILAKKEELAGYKPPEMRDQSLLSRVEIELTQQCNLACLHCFTEKTKQSFDIRLLEKNLQELEKLGVVEVDLNGGEIFLHKHIAEILDMLQHHFKIILFSNGTLDYTVEVASQYKIARINISLDGFKESHEYLRGPGTYEKTLDTIEKLTKIGMAVQINAVVYPKNIGDLENFIGFCRDSLHVHDVKLGTIYPLGESPRHAELFTDNRLSKEIYDKYFHEEFPNFGTGQYLPCMAGINKLYINARGEMYPCRLFEAPEFIMGSLTQASLSEIYHNFLASDNCFTRFTLDNIPTCKTCPALPKCKTGCRARAHILQKNLASPDKFACKHYLVAAND